MTDNRWRKWWGGPERPYLVLTPEQIAAPKWHATANKEFPGVLLVEAKMLPLMPTEESPA